jgi:hypothetical protein
VRARLGTYVHPVLIATDRRVLMARASSEAAANPDAQAFEVAWAIPYAEIRSFSSKNTGGESPDEIVRIQTADRNLEYTMVADDGRAFVAILKRRAPEALSAPESDQAYEIDSPEALAAPPDPAAVRALRH